MTLDAVTILLVEDNDDDVVLIKESLTESGLVNILQVARDGEEAMAFLRCTGEYKSAARPGLILLDINMPKMNGFEVLEEVKADPVLKQIPIVMLTAGSGDEDVIRAYRQGACSFIRKPVSLDEFRNTVKQFALYWALVAITPDRVQGK